MSADVVILPLRRTSEGLGVYAEEAQFLAKELRAAGVEAQYLDPTETRAFVSTHSVEVLALAGAFLLGIASNAGWDAVKVLFRARGSDRRVELTYIDLGGPDDAGGKQWIARGMPGDVVEAIEAIRDAAGLNQHHRNDAVGGEPTSDFQEDGSDEDLRNEYRNQHVSERLSSAENLLAEARTILGRDPGASRLAEVSARKSLEAFASALNWAEGHEGEVDIHNRLDAAGKWVRERFGCSLAYEAGEYHQRCPVALGHLRIGLSVGGVARSTCSLCGLDVSECAHRRGRAYLVPGGYRELGWCRVCLKEDVCEHKSHLMYRVSVVSIIKALDVEEVSMVTSPAHPDARLQSVGVSTEGLRATLGDGFTPGMRVNCDRCLLPCDGLISADLS